MKCALFIFILFVTTVAVIAIVKTLSGISKDKKNDLAFKISKYLIENVIKVYIKNKAINIDTVYRLDYGYFSIIYKRELKSILENKLSNKEFLKEIQEGLSLEENLEKYYKSDLFKDAINKAVDNVETNILIQYQFMSDVNSGLQEVNKSEETAIEYHKQFGTEESGDPELHPKEPNNGEYSEDDSSEKTLDDLLSTGTVEDIEE